MNIPNVNHARACEVMACLFFSLQVGAAQFVELTADVETAFWYPEALNARSWTVRCVVGTNMWRMDGDFIRDERQELWVLDEEDYREASELLVAWRQPVPPEESEQA